ncbi:phosphopantetheine-binding protein [Kribbella flavida DSM 17836]|uniref:Phosphopantetheine-binding protein n=2 Tax=Kribbella flavida TaxID=182640 RepID=D2PSP8_KRIFD|nr:phosphopantetheine-binding protein [Kribbella flavida DSM 17836]
MEHLQQTWPDAFEETVRSLLPAYPAQQPLPPDASFRSVGLDSLGIMTLVMRLQQRFAVRFPPAVVAIANFETPAAAWRTVSAALDDNS